MFCTFSLQSILLATAACNFLTSELQKVLRTPRVLYMFTSKMCFSPQRCAIFRHPNFKKMLRTSCVLCILTSKCAFRHSGGQFFDIRTSETAPTMRCFVHFHFKMCFSPQRRAICDFSAEHLPPPTFSTDPTHESLKKTQHFATSLTFGADVSSFFWLSRYCIFFLLTWLLYSAFSTVHIGRKFAI